MKRLITKAWIAIIGWSVFIALLIFGAAGTIHYWQAWLYLVIALGASVLTTLDVIKRDPALFERRMRTPAAEKRASQRVIMLLFLIMFLALILVPALDRRFGGSHVPTAVVIAGDVLVLVGMYLVAQVYRANTFASTTIEIHSGQRVISTGPYGVVRHPLYATMLLYLIGTPLALGSYWGLLAVGAMIPLLMWRLLDEEQLLTHELQGYTEYQQRVRHRLVPYIW